MGAQIVASELKMNCAIQVEVDDADLQYMSQDIPALGDNKENRKMPHPSTPIKIIRRWKISKMRQTRRRNRRSPSNTQSETPHEYYASENTYT